MFQFLPTKCQDYDVTDIQCTFATNPTTTNTITAPSVRDQIVARLKKPEGFRGNPLFADDRAVDPEADPLCQIRPDPQDSTGLTYNLKISEFNRCGVLKRNVSIRLFTIGVIALSFE